MDNDEVIKLIKRKLIFQYEGNNNKEVDFIKKDLLYDYRFIRRDNELYKGIYYFLFEEYLTQSLFSIEKKINNELNLPRFKINNQLFSLKEVENNIQKSWISKNIKIKAKDVFEKEIKKLHSEKWKFIQSTTKDINSLSYTELYREYFGEKIAKIYSMKSHIMPVIRKGIEKQNQKFKPQNNNTDIDLVNDVKVATTNMGIEHNNFNTIKVFTERKEYSMYTNGLDANIDVNLGSENDIHFIHKSWHEFGHAIHYLNMDSNLSYVFRKLHYTYNMEAIAILFQIIANEFYGKSPQSHLYEMIWWNFVEFFSLYEYLKNINDDSSIFVTNNLRYLFNTPPTIPCPIRYFSKGFKSFRYVVGFFVALGLFDFCVQNYKNLINKQSGLNNS